MEGMWRLKRLKTFIEGEGGGATSSRMGEEEGEDAIASCSRPNPNPGEEETAGFLTSPPRDLRLLLLEEEEEAVNTGSA